MADRRGSSYDSEIPEWPSLAVVCSLRETRHDLWETGSQVHAWACHSMLCSVVKHMLLVTEIVTLHQTQRRGCWLIAELLVCGILQYHETGGGYFFLPGCSVTRIFWAQLHTPLCEDLGTWKLVPPLALDMSIVYLDCNTIWFIQMIPESGFFIIPNLVLTFVHGVTLPIGGRGRSNDIAPDPVDRKGLRWYPCWVDGYLRTQDV